MVLGHLAAIAKALVKAGKNMALRLANQQAGGVVHTIVIDEVVAWTDEGIDALWRLLGDWFKREDQQREALQAVVDATPAEWQAAVEQESAGIDPEIRERLVEVAHSFRTAIVKHCEPPDAQGQSPLRRDFSIQTLEQLAALLLPATRATTGFAELRAGDWVAERYRVVRTLGRGGMGIVYLVDNSIGDGGDGKPLALKMIRPDLLTKSEVQRRFLSEGELTRDLRHENIVAVHDVAYDRGRKQYYLTMGYLGGQALDEWVAAQGGQPVGLEPFHKIVNAICGALAYAHIKNVMHLDIKPKNVMVSDDLREVKLLDFGLAKVFTATKIAMTQADGGTAYYMAPEVLNDGQAELRSDQYSLAVLCYELLVRRKPVAGAVVAQQIAKYRSDVPVPVAKAIQRAMMPEPDQRFESIEKFRAALNAKSKPRKPPSAPPQVLPGVTKPAAFAAVPLSPPHEIALDLGGGVKLQMVLIPAGEFMMGSPDGELERSGDEGPQRPVKIARPFYLGKHQVTQAQWQAILGSNPSHFKGDSSLPVETVSWEECQEFCRKVSSRSGKHVRLPSEAEWEYACRAGTTTPFHFGSTISTDQANYDGNYIYGSGRKGKYREKTTPVGSFAANAWGLYDMHGNVWEWCEDWYRDNYDGAPTDGSPWLSGGEQQSRVLRGGSWYGIPGGCRSAYRSGYAPDFRGDDIGFRVASGTA